MFRNNIWGWANDYQKVNWGHFGWKFRNRTFVIKLYIIPALDVPTADGTAVRTAALHSVLLTLGERKVVRECGNSLC
jgi:hypothetical protein